MAVTVDAETRIKGDGNVIINYGRKDNVGSHGNGTSDELSNLSMREGMGEGGGRRKRAISVRCRIFLEFFPLKLSFHLKSGLRMAELTVRSVGAD